MNELTLHPNVYATGASRGLISILERIWVREHSPGDGSIYVVSGFANYNGGVRFYEVFRDHVSRGGTVTAVLAGSTGARLTSRQVVTEMLSCGAKVCIINRKRLLHAKCYGSTTSRGQFVVVTSGNFTGPGMSQNAEISVLLDHDTVGEMGFSWDALIDSLLSQKWDIYLPSLTDLSGPAWQLLYDEQAGDVAIDESDEVTMVMTLGHADTVRINAQPGSDASKGTQYFWLSKDCYDFFPPLTIRNVRGTKSTYSALIELRYIDLSVSDTECRVTFEAENNLDFRLGTGKLRNSRIAREGDLAALTRLGEREYELRIAREGTAEHSALLPYALNFIGHQGKKYGFLPNAEFHRLIHS